MNFVADSYTGFVDLFHAELDVRSVYCITVGYYITSEIALRTSQVQ